MIITFDKTLTEAYWDMVNKSSGKDSPQEVAPIESAGMSATAMPDFIPPETDSFWLKLTGKLTAWLRKHAD